MGASEVGIVSWRVVLANPHCGAIWTVLQTGPKTFPQLLDLLRAPPTSSPLIGSGGRVLPGTLFKRLDRMKRAGLVQFEQDSAVVARWEKAGICHRDPPDKRGRPSGGFWWADSSNSTAIQAALAHANLLSQTPGENLTLERFGGGSEVLIAGTEGDVARWWYPQNFHGKLGTLFQVADMVGRELARTVLASNPDAVRAQRQLRKVARRLKAEAERKKVPIGSFPPVKEALIEANTHEFLLSIRVLPGGWWDDSGLPVDFVSKADVTLAHIHELTKPPSMPLDAVSPEMAAEFARQEARAENGVTILAATRTRPNRQTRRRKRPRAAPS